MAKRLIVATDHGHPVSVPASSFAIQQRTGDWGPYAETFLRFNSDALRFLDVSAEVVGRSTGTIVRLLPGGCTGAIPLRSGVSGQVAGGLVVRPRFGWVGVGRVLQDIGWDSGLQLPGLALVPGSAREVPSWVLAGPALSRIEALLRTLSPEFSDAEQIVAKPRGRIVWPKYVSEALVRGQWHHLPCRFPDLSSDPLLLRYVRWALERILRDLLESSAYDSFGLGLAAMAASLIRILKDVAPLTPRRGELDRRIGGGRLASRTMIEGIEAITWIVDERGLGGGSERDGLSWTMQLETLWERYVESVYRRETAVTGGDVRVGRLGETVFPLEWTDPTHRTMGHLVPDMVIRHGSSVQVVDAKYKAHLAELDETSWRSFADETRAAHRADIHQILAYAALYDAEEITATLVYPVRPETYLSLRDRGRDRSYAELYRGGRRVRIELRGLPFGMLA